MSSSSLPSLTYGGKHAMGQHANACPMPHSVSRPPWAGTCHTSCSKPEPTEHNPPTNSASWGLEQTGWGGEGWRGEAGGGTGRERLGVGAGVERLAGEQEAEPRRVQDAPGLG